jgi:hypothetical protein
MACAFVGSAALGDSHKVPRNIAGASPTALFCNVTKDWKLGILSPKELCEKYNGSFCSSEKPYGKSICEATKKSFCDGVKNTGEGICLAGDGSFCSGVKSTAQGICEALKESFCSGETDEAKWNKKLSEACHW